MSAIFPFSPPQNAHGCSRSLAAQHRLWNKIPQDTIAGSLTLQEKSGLLANWGGSKPEILGPKHSVSVFWDGHNKVTETGWLQTTEMYSLIGQKSKNQGVCKSGVFERKTVLCLSPGF